jgi:hypothetical protein
MKITNMGTANTENNQEIIRQIFDIGWNCRLTPCYIKWLSKILRKQYWKISSIPFISEIIEKKKKDDDSFRTVYDCGYWETLQSSGFKDGYIKQGCHENLHQAIHCLNKCRRIPFDKIAIEQRFYGGYQVDVLAKTNSEKYIVVELGNLSSYGKFGLIYEPHVEELWFDGKGQYFYILRANGKLPTEESFEHTLTEFPKNECDVYNCLVYSHDIYEECNYIRKYKNLNSNQLH